MEGAGRERDREGGREGGREGRFRQFRGGNHWQANERKLEENLKTV